MTVARHGLYAQGYDTTEDNGVEVVDDGQERLNSSHVDLISSFHRAVIDCSYGLVEATQAHEKSDPELFVVSANHAVKAWIDAHATYRALAQALSDAPVIQAARLGLDQRCHDLSTLLSTAENTFTKSMILAQIISMRESLRVARD